MAIRQPKPVAPTFTPSRYHGKRMSEREFLALPEEKPYLEYIDGVVEQKPMANSKHRRIVGRLDAKFSQYTDDYGGDFGPEGRVGLATGDYFVPDSSYWVDGIDSGDDSTPTVAVEVRSPGQSMGRLREKCRRYLRDGSAAAWLIDPEARTVEVFEGTDVRKLKAGDALTSHSMPGFELALDDLFSVLDR